MQSVSLGRISLDNCTCCHTEVEAADQTCCLIQPQSADTRPASSSTDPLPLDAGMTRLGKAESLARGRNSSVGSVWARCPA